MENVPEWNRKAPERFLKESESLRSGEGKGRCAKRKTHPSKLDTQPHMGISGGTENPGNGK